MQSLNHAIYARDPYLSRYRLLLERETIPDATRTIKLMFAGINMFWARLRLILTQAVSRHLK